MEQSQSAWADGSAGRLVFDLDPGPDAAFSVVTEAAREREIAWMQRPGKLLQSHWAARDCLNPARVSSPGVGQGIRPGDLSAHGARHYRKMRAGSAWFACLPEGGWRPPSSIFRIVRNGTNRSRCDDITGHGGGADVGVSSTPSSQQRGVYGN